MKLFDSHAHLDMKKYGRGQVRSMLDAAFDADVAGIIAIAGSGTVNEYSQTLDIANSDPRIWATAGIHPHTSSFATPDALDKLRFALDHKRIVALGEIGLDYHYNHSSQADQRRGFINQLKAAHEARLPVVIHTREAADDTLAIMRDEGADELGGVIHCFSGDMKLASQSIDLGFYLSFSGIVTFPGASEVQEVAAWAPQDRILSETDTPFLSPVPWRGRPNEPARVLHVVEKLAELKDCDAAELSNIIYQNTLNCFSISNAEY